MTMTSESKEYFKNVAQDWDTIREGYFSTDIRRAAIARSHLRPDAVVADIGAGTGFISTGLAPLVQKVHLVDGSKAMLEKARANLQQFNNIEYHLADGLSIPLPDDSMDAVFANMYLHHCPEPPAAIREITRILRPGGRLVITDLDRHTNLWMPDEMADAWPGFDRSEIFTWFKEAGLVNIILDSTAQNCCAQSQNHNAEAQENPQVKVNIFAAVGTKPVADMRSQVQDSYGDLARSECRCGQRSGIGARCCDETGEESISPVEMLVIKESLPEDVTDFSLGCGNPVALANLKSGEDVLDIGSGGGLDCFRAARRVGPEGKVIGVDMTPDMIARAKQSLEKTEFKNVEFRLGFAEELPVEDASIDVVISNCVINLTADKGRIFQEVYRVLRPGGRLEVSDIVTDRSLPADINRDAAHWSACVSGALPENEYLSLMAQTGFSGIIVRKKVMAEEIQETGLYSVTVTATKPAPETGQNNGCTCGCG